MRFTLCFLSAAIPDMCTHYVLLVQCAIEAFEHLMDAERCNEGSAAQILAAIKTADAAKTTGQYLLQAAGHARSPHTLAHHVQHT